jgi:hypothetical protein
VHPIFLVGELLIMLRAAGPTVCGTSWANAPRLCKLYKFVILIFSRQIFLPLVVANALVIQLAVRTAESGVFQLLPTKGVFPQKNGFGVSRGAWN